VGDIISEQAGDIISEWVGDIISERRATSSGFCMRGQWGSLLPLRIGHESSKKELLGDLLQERERERERRADADRARAFEAEQERRKQA
jgi:hypothetical protein